MKISLRWVFDHIKENFSQLDVSYLTKMFIKTTAEIDSWKKVQLDCRNLTLATIVTINTENIVVYSAEFNQKYSLPFRSDLIVDNLYLIVVDEQKAEWASIMTLGGTKETLLPALYVEQSLVAGGWKNNIELEDYVIEIDNKSINHRPDLWGHRGIAREIAAMLTMTVINYHEMVNDKAVINTDSLTAGQSKNTFSVSVESQKDCSRFSTFYISSIKNQASHLDMVIRLSRIDSRSIDFLVDCTNYVMFDIGQPMHAFDADKLHEKNIIVRRAKKEEKLTVLDGETLTLTHNDIVISDGGEKAISLAGVMGGMNSAITSNTKSVFLEAAHFNATLIRRTAARYKKRTEASSRFEKSLDSHNTIFALQRFLFLLDKAGVSYQAEETIFSVGSVGEPLRIVVLHSFIEKRLGTAVSVEHVISILQKLFFEVSYSKNNDDTEYVIIVPSFRATKDIKIAEDIVEEVGRFVGYDTITCQLPSFAIAAHDLSTIYKARAIKRFLSYGLLMRELHEYSFFDETFLHEIGWEPASCVEVKNPISEHYVRLSSTLQPHLFKAVADNSMHHKRLRFYEWSRIWSVQDDTVVEKQSLCGVFFSQDKLYDFYDGKSLLSSLFDELSLKISWERTAVEFLWFVEYQTAQLMHEGKKIGIAGMVNDTFVSQLSSAGGSMFVFELDADYLVAHKNKITQFVPLSKYPSVRRDASLLIPLSLTVDFLEKLIYSVDEKIISVILIDFFTKPDWKEHKSVTFHVEMADQEKTLEHDEVEALWNKVLARLQEHGAVIR